MGTVDAADNLWASLLVGKPGFLSSPDDSSAVLSDRTLRVAAQPLFGDPLTTTLADGIDIGLLGIELHTRRRNRLNGKVTAIHANSFDVRVGQSFGNCPKYIQTRMFELIEDDDPTATKPVHQVTALGAAEQAMISGADTFFIASAYQDESVGATGGVDVNTFRLSPNWIRLDG